MAQDLPADGAPDKSWWRVVGTNPYTLREGEVVEFEGKSAVYYETEGPNYRSRNYYLKGDEGIYLLGITMTGEHVDGTVMTYDPPVLAFPSNLTVGHQWRAKYKMKRSGKDGSVTKTKVSSRNEITAREPVSVPAGTFDCYRIETKSGTNDAKSTVVSWYSPEVGYYVRIESTEGFSIKSDLVEYRLSASPLLLGASGAPKPKAPARLTAQVAFSEPSGNNILDAMEKGKLVVTVANAGLGPAYGVRMTASPEKSISGLAFSTTEKISKLDPGKSETREISLEASKEIGSQPVSVRLEVKEANGFDADPKLVKFETKGYRAPRLEIAALSLGGLGVVKAGEPAQIVLTVRNSGEGPAQNAAAVLEIASPDIFASGETRQTLGGIEPGQSRKIEFEFFVNKRYKGDKRLPLAVSLTEAEGRFGVKSLPLGLELGSAAPALEVVTVSGRHAPSPAPAVTDVEDVDVPPATATPRDADAYAVVIGIEKYRDVPPVDYAARDAQTVHGYLTRAMGFDPKNVILLQNERATGRDLDKYLGKWLKNQVSDKSKVFIYYAGHGAPNPATGEGYLIPYDGDPSYTEDTAFPVKKLLANLAKLPAKNVTVALDACFSGAGGRSVIAKGARPLVNVAKAPPSAPNTLVLSAASAEQISTSHPDGRHGLMTYHLLKGLRGEADSNKDGRITTAELFGYVSPAVEREARAQNVEQTPTLNPAPEALGSRGEQAWIITK